MDKVKVYYNTNQYFETECESYEIEGNYVVLYDEEGETREIVQANRIIFEKGDIDLEDL